MHLGSQQIAPACVQSNLLGLGIGSWCCVVEPMLTELVKTTTVTNRRRAHYRVHGVDPHLEGVRFRAVLSSTSASILLVNRFQMLSTYFAWLGGGLP